VLILIIIGVAIYFYMNQSTSAPTTSVPTTTRPATTVPATTVPATTKPATIVPATTKPVMTSTQFINMIDPQIRSQLSQNVLDVISKMTTSQLESIDPKKIDWMKLYYIENPVTSGFNMPNMPVGKLAVNSKRQLIILASIGNYLLSLTK
jgi:hypothetical protein